MSSSSLLTGGLRLLAVAIVALSVGACAQKQVQDGMGAGAGAATPGSAQDFAVNVGDRVLFLTDQTSLTGQARETLNRQAQWLQLYPNTSVIIEGHADERGTREYNLGLSARRATVVRDYLVSRGIPASRLRTVSYGKERPAAVCENESCWSQNRRAVTVVDSATS